MKVGAKLMRWTQREDIKLMFEYPHRRAKEIAYDLGRSEMSVHIRACRLKLAKKTVPRETYGPRRVLAPHKVCQPA